MESYHVGQKERHINIESYVLDATSHLKNTSCFTSKAQTGQRIDGISIPRLSKLSLVGSRFKRTCHTKIFTFLETKRFHLIWQPVITQMKNMIINSSSHIRLPRTPQNILYPTTICLHCPKMRYFEELLTSCLIAWFLLNSLICIRHCHGSTPHQSFSRTHYNHDLYLTKKYKEKKSNKFGHHHPSVQIS